MSVQNVQSVPQSGTFFQNLQRVLRQNIREYGMFIALFVIMLIFALATGGTFVSSRNLSNLLNQTGYIAVLAVGMTLVIVIRHIDLSVGFLAGFLGAVAAIALSRWGLPVYLVIPLVLFLGYAGGPAHRAAGGPARHAFVCGLAGRMADLPRLPPAGDRGHRHDHHLRRDVQRPRQRLYPRLPEHGRRPRRGA